MYRFWRWLLSPLSLVYFGLYKLWWFSFNWRVPYVSRRFVISVGNLSVGGSGKTPMVMHLLEFLEAQNTSCAVLSRGYKAKHKKHLQVAKPESQHWGLIGDEPSLIAEAFPKTSVYICKDRVLAAKTAEPHADVLIMDDGFQHQKLARDLDIVLVDALPALPDDHLLPLGALREPWSALQRAHAIVLSKTNLVKLDQLNERLEKIKRNLGPNIPIFQSKLHVSGLYSPKKQMWHAAEMLNDQTCILCCAIGNPLGFEYLVQHLGGKIKAKLFLPDHHRYNQKVIKKIQRLQKKYPAAWVITTTKDWVKLRALKFETLWVLHTQLEVEKAFFTFFKKRLAQGVND